MEEKIMTEGEEKKSLSFVEQFVKEDLAFHPLKANDIINSRRLLWDINKITNIKHLISVDNLLMTSI